jgi:hypothetical protein
VFAVIASWDRREEADPRFMKLFGRRSMGYF